MLQLYEKQKIEKYKNKYKDLKDNVVKLEVKILYLCIEMAP